MHNVMAEGQARVPKQEGERERVRGYIVSITYLIYVLVGLYQLDAQLSQWGHGRISKVCGNAGLHGAHLRRRRRTRVLKNCKERKNTNRRLVRQTRNKGEEKIMNMMKQELYLHDA